MQLASILQAPEFLVPQGVSVKFDPLRIFLTPIFIEVIAFFGQPYDPYRGRRGRAGPLSLAPPLVQDPPFPPALNPQFAALASDTIL